MSKIDTNIKKIFRVILENERDFNELPVYKHIPKIKKTNVYHNVIRLLQEDKPELLKKMADNEEEYKKYTNVRIKNVKEKPTYVYNLIVEILVELLSQSDIDTKEFTYYSQDLGNIREEYNKMHYAQALAKTFQMEEAGEIEDVIIPFLPFKMNWGQFYLIVGKPGGSKTDLMVRISDYLVKTKQKFEYYNLEIKDRLFFDRLALMNKIGKFKVIMNRNGEEYTKHVCSASEKIALANKFLDFGNLYDIDYNNIKQIEATIKNTEAKFILVDYLDFIDLGESATTEAWKKADLTVKKLTYLAKKYNKIVFCIGVLNKSEGEPTIYNVSGGQSTRHDPDGILCLEKHEDGILLRVLKSRSSAVGATFVQEFDAGTKQWGSQRKGEE
jgi:hypothetical protein